MSRKGSREGIDEITASIDQVLADYDEGGLGWSKDGQSEPSHIVDCYQGARLASWGPVFDEVYHPSEGQLWVEAIIEHWATRAARPTFERVLIDGRPADGVQSISITRENALARGSYGVPYWTFDITPTDPEDPS